MDIQQIEQELKTGQVSPPRLAEMKDYLAAESSTIMDRQLELHMLYAKWFQNHRGLHKSDKSAYLAWCADELGKEELILETRQKKIKVLREAISSHLRVASDAARNMY
ncbi:MAG TPA: hypothetical protein VEA59_00355 [Patescibacteria group bacterium]|nr:hypothetical protein [Patescibacteria group bacterium]